MNTNLQFPAVYQRGMGVLADLGAFCMKKTNKVFIVGGEKALQVAKQRIIESLEASNIEIVGAEWYGGECTWENINKLSDLVEERGAQLLIAVGGGKALDTSKAVAYKNQIPCVTVPTIAATCAAFTPISIIHDQEGHYVSNTPLAVCPEAVFIETEIILDAPAKWLYAGMGDTLAKWYELRATTSKIPTTSWTLGGINNGKICYEVIKEFGPGAKEAIERQIINDALNYVIDAIVFYAGMSSILGGEDCRGAAAHSLYFGFTNIPAAHAKGHGLLVGFGNLCLLALEKRSREEILPEIELARSCGVPVRLDEIAALTEDDLEKIARVASEAKAMKNMPFAVTKEMVLEAMKFIDGIR